MQRFSPSRVRQREGRAGTAVQHVLHLAFPLVPYFSTIEQSREAANKMNKAEYLDSFARLIVEVESVIKRPNSYFGRSTPTTAQAFCMGVNCAILVFGGKLSHELHLKALESRGWKFTSTDGLDLMQERGLSEEQIVEELLRLQIIYLELMAQCFADTL